MRVLVVGRGGREHALIWKLKQSPLVEKLYCAPGNGGIASLAETVGIAEDDIDQLVAFATKERIDLTVVGPEASLMAGIVDRFKEAGLSIFGPTKQAALIEGSKSFAKRLMTEHSIPTAKYRVFSNGQQARDYVNTIDPPYVLKVDGLAAGKGVSICQTKEEAQMVIDDCLTRQALGETGQKLVIEEFLTGEELSLMAFVAKDQVLPMQAAQDHKRLLEGDKGPNTGGMGAYSPVSHIPSSVIDEAVSTILYPAAKALQTIGSPFYGVLYAGLMITSDGPKVIEFNARFGDPESQAVLPLLKSDLLEVLLATVNSQLNTIELAWQRDHAVAVMASSQGYPYATKTGYPVTLTNRPGSLLFHSGTKLKGDHLVSDGGRVLCATGLGASFELARTNAYSGMEGISFPGMYYRKDIGWRAN